MNNDSSTPLVIVGGGPVALACALLRAQVSFVRVLIPALETKPLVPRIEVVPAVTLALLTELGVHPHAIGVYRLMRQRLMAWDNVNPVEVTLHEAAHLERPALDQALLTLVLRNRHIELIRVDAGATRRLAQSLARAGNRIIDATGRSSVLADICERPSRPWVARVFDINTAATGTANFMIAAYSEGYIYRASGAHRTTVGVVGRGKQLRGNSQAILKRLQRNKVSWIVDDLSRSKWTDAGAWQTSLQWSKEGSAISIGDAALARDPLSSQGLANGLSDACYAASIQTERDTFKILQRNFQARLAHIRALSAMIGNCYCRDAPIWREYCSFLDESQTSGSVSTEFNKPASIGQHRSLKDR